jgi:alpha-tubulin suppressor-like RCC1 family protein
MTQAMPSVTTPAGLGLGASFFCVLDSGGGVSCAGNGQHGQLGNGFFGSSATPVSVQFGTSFATSIVVGANHACSAAGIHAQCWGAAGSGQLGPISSTDINKPSGFSVGDAGVVVGAGGDTTCVVFLPPGRVDCFGSNLEGQLNLDAGTLSSGTRQTVLTTGASNVWVGSTAACALVGSQAQCWGQADGTDPFSPPIGEGNFGNVTQVALGATGGCALLMTHQVYCWGANDVGQLGIGSSDQSSHYPPTTPVMGISDAVSIARSDDHACAVHADGRVSCWGNNTSGQVTGNGIPTTSEATPVAVPVPQ